MRIVSVEPFLLHVPVTSGGIADGAHALRSWGAPGVRITTACGRVGTGYTGTHAHLPTDRAIALLIDEAYGPLLIGRDPREVRALWVELAHHPPIRWVGRAGLTHLALAAIDVALWDLKAQEADQPLWRLLGGGAGKRLEAYDTDGGWLDRSDAQLVDEARARIDQGYRAVKIKVGSADPARDLRRVEAVRGVLPAGARLMVDANGSWDRARALEVGRRLADFEVTWLEEPIAFDDLPGHVALARALTTPIALGEQLYTTDAFRDFLAADAVHYVQADAVRLAGVTEWWTVADLAHAHGKPVVPHIGDMMQVHLHLAWAHPACTLLERIPWMRDGFVEPASVEDGRFVRPERPGAGTALRDDALERWGVRVR